MKFNIRDEKGFTLLEATVSLLISSFTLLFITLSTQQLKVMNDFSIVDSQELDTASKLVKGNRQIEWHIFLNQLEQYLNETKFLNLENNVLTVKEWNEESKVYEEILYHQAKSGKKDFRRSKYNGNNTLLTDIKECKLKRNNNWLFLNFTFLNNEKYEGKIWINQWEE